MPRFTGKNKGDETTIKDLTELTHQERLVIGLERIKAERGLKNKDLAAMLGVTEGYMSQVIRGKRDVKLTMLDKMTRQFRVTTSDLFNVSEDDLRRPLREESGRRRSKKKMAERHLAHAHE
ncbi:MAG: XRE family transcriptional regulator [Mesorhizobium sp.]|uniref:helix-turn-helix domain-containing protein n=1 Tax=Mesorhizobium sp. TaxID=1871066 RepID=UPI000FE90D8D|nr:MAG: XRE family transcriptional regulator [Mesorhizobium sp.]